MKIHGSQADFVFLILTIFKSLVLLYFMCFKNISLFYLKCWNFYFRCLKNKNELFSSSPESECILSTWDGFRHIKIILCIFWGALWTLTFDHLQVHVLVIADVNSFYMHHSSMFMSQNPPAASWSSEASHGSIEERTPWIVLSNDRWIRDAVPLNDSAHLIRKHWHDQSLTPHQRIKIRLVIEYDKTIGYTIQIFQI